jgi:hypothetical protein
VAILLPEYSMLILLFLLVNSSETHRVEIEPFDFQDENNPATYATGMKQIECNGSDLFISLLRRPVILQIETDGTFVRAIGKKGQGPGELGWHAVWAISVRGERLWALRDDLTLANYYENGNHMHTIRPSSYQFRGSRMVAYRFAFDNEHIVIQTHPGTGFLANVYDYNGNVRRQVGKTFPVRKEFLARNPSLYSTIWAHDGERWYCLFVHRPILRVFGKDFELEKEFILSAPEIEALEEVFYKNEKDPNWTYPRPHFTDIQVQGKDILIMCDGTLYQVNKETGEVLSRTYFFGGKELREKHGIDSARLEYFAVNEENKIFLGISHFMFDHDLWTAQLPFRPRFD